MIRVRLSFNSILPKILCVDAITLYPFIFFRRRRSGILCFYKHTLRHEMIHVRQIRAWGVFDFYTQYLIEYFKNLFKYRSHSAAYYKISFEVEAYTKQHNELTKAERNELRRYTG